LSAREHGMAHGGDKTGRPGDLAGQRRIAEKRLEQRLQRAGHGLETLGEGGAQARHDRSPRDATGNVRSRVACPRRADRSSLGTDRGKEMAANVQARGRGRLAIGRAVLRWIMRAALAIVLFWSVSIAAYRVLPPVSTLMLGRWLTLQPVERIYVPLSDISPH